MSTISAENSVLLRWLEQMRPRRLLIVEGGPPPTTDNSDRDAFPRQLCQRASELLGDQTQWGSLLPERFRPGVTTMDASELGRLDGGPTFDLALCPQALLEMPLGAAKLTLDQLRRSARFIGVVVSMAESVAPATELVGWGDADWQVLQPLLMHEHDGRLTLLLRGGRAVEELPKGRIWYLAPNNQIFGGVKILYNHVDILNASGIPAVLATDTTVNWPADWFAWNPRNLCFAADAPRQAGPEDIVVIPEFQYEKVKDYRQVARRLLFSQNPGLTRGFSRWKRLGYDGVLTLNIPDGRISQLHEFLLDRSPLPIYPISNHYSDDPWGKASASRIPGRILCLPRKGKEFVERISREFPSVHCVDNCHQFRMAIEYAEADVYVHTGFPEGQPMPPIEAMRSGCVVCGFTGKGGLDVMLDGRTAYVAEDGNMQQLLTVVRRALEDPAREAVRQAGRQIAGQFDRSVTAGELAECYRNWVDTLPTRNRNTSRRRA